MKYFVLLILMMFCGYDEKKSLINDNEKIPIENYKAVPIGYINDIYILYSIKIGPKNYYATYIYSGYVIGPEIKND